MDKIRDIKPYIDTVKKNSEFFKKYYYHSLIDLNLVKLDYILNYGILSKKMIEQQRLINIYTHDSSDFDSKNGDSFISLSEYTDKSEFSALFESFSFHTLTSVSVLIDKSINISREGERETYFDDEVFCFHSIPKSKFKGILLPEHLSNLAIEKVNCLPDDLSCYTRNYINNWLACMELYFKQKIKEKDIKEIKESFDNLWVILDEYESPEKWIQSAIKTQRRQNGQDLKDILSKVLQNFWSKKLGITNPKYIDVLKQININNLPVYEINKKCLKLIK